MIDFVLRYTIPAAYALLPEPMASLPATAMLLAIGLQESRFLHRRQVHGPARGWWQFEPSGVAGVLEHPMTAPVIDRVLRQLHYAPTAPAAEILTWIEHNDVLACCLARCLLWTSQVALPPRSGHEVAWHLYMTTWRPGKPHRETWDSLYGEAWTRTLFDPSTPRTEERRV